MRLRHLTKNVKDQNWFAVFLDFLIVVLGVFVGIQLGNWNGDRQTRASLADAQARFVAENKANSEAIDVFLTRSEARLNEVSKAIETLRNCQNDDSAQQVLNNGLNSIRGTGFLRIRTTALEGLTGNDDFLSLLPEDERETLKEMQREITQTQKNLDWLEDRPFHNHIEDYRGVAYGELETFGTTSAKVRPIYLEIPFAEACQDKNLLSKFYLWERATNFQMLRANQLNETLQAFE